MLIRDNATQKHFVEKLLILIEGKENFFYGDTGYATNDSAKKKERNDSLTAGISFHVRCKATNKNIQCCVNFCDYVTCTRHALQIAARGIVSCMQNRYSHHTWVGRVFVVTVFGIFGPDHYALER